LVVAVVGRTRGQEPSAPELPRSLTFGRATNLAGEPWVGATVHLLARPVADAPFLPVVDRLEVTTDEQGRYRGDVLRGWSYSVWAQAEAVDGVVRLSGVREDVRAGMPADLVERAQPWRGLAIAVDGLDKWAGDGPFRFELESASPPLWMQGALGAGPAVELPVIPATQATVRVLDARGKRLAALDVDLLDEPAPRISVQPPRVVQARMFGEDFKQAVAGGVITEPRRWQHWPVAELDQNGRAEFRIPDPGPRFQGWRYRALLDGRAAGFMLDDLENPPTDAAARRILDAGGMVVRGGLQAATVVRGRLLGLRGQPIVGASLLMVSEAHGQVDESLSYGSGHQWIATTDGEGRFVGQHFFRDQIGEVRLVLSQDVLRQLPADWVGGLHPVAIVTAVPRGTDALDLGDVHLARSLAPWELLVQTVEGLPAAHALVHFYWDQNPQYVLPAMRADRTGRLRVLMPRRGTVTAILSHNTGALVRRFEIEAAEEDGVAPVTPWVVRLDPSMEVVGTVRDASGAPVADATVYLSPRHEEPYDLGRALGDPIDLGSTTLRPVAISEPRCMDALTLLFREGRATTDERGRYRVVIPALRGTVGIAATHRAGDQWLRAPERALDLVGEPEVFDLELPGTVEGGR